MSANNTDKKGVQEYISEVSDNSAEESNQKTRINRINELHQQFIDVTQKANVDALTGEIDEYTATTAMRTSLFGYVSQLAILMKNHDNPAYWNGDEDDPIATYELSYPEPPRGYTVSRITGINNEWLDWDEDAPPTVTDIYRNPETITITGIQDFIELPTSFRRVIECYPPPPSGMREWPEREKPYYLERRERLNQLDQNALINVFYRTNEFVNEIGLDVELHRKTDATMDREELEKHIDGVIPEPKL